MKLLFVIDRAHADDDPNINLVRGLVPYLSCETHSKNEGEMQNNFPSQDRTLHDGVLQKDCAAEIRFLGHTAQKRDADALCFYYGRDEAVRTLYVSLNKLSGAQKAWQLVRHPVNSVFGAFKLLHIDLIARAYRKHLEAVCRDWRPDAVIAVAAPFYTAKAVAAARVPCRKIIWMLDPYGTHYLTGGKTAQAQERRCLARVQKIFVPELIYHEYQDMPHVLPMAFPGLCAPQEAYGEEADGDVIAAPSAQESASLSAPVGLPIRLVFVGSLYADIRNPAHLLRLVRALGSGVQLTLVGGLYGKYTPAFHEEFDAFLATQVKQMGKVSRQAAQRFLQQADVLVNIGNTVNNQLPSKIFEYFAAGLPILNLKQISQCPADVYLRRYPLAYTVDTTQPLTEQVVEDANCFLQQNVGKHMPFAEVKALFLENTPEAVAQKLRAAVRGE